VTNTTLLIFDKVKAFNKTVPNFWVTLYAFLHNEVNAAACSKVVAYLVKKDGKQDAHLRSPYSILGKYKYVSLEAGSPRSTTQM